MHHHCVNNTPTIPSDRRAEQNRVRSGLQGLEEPTSDEVLRELCDKNYHQLLPLIAEKMKKEKEQQDKLNAVKARLLYGDESGKNPKNHEESHYSESKTQPHRTEAKKEARKYALRSPNTNIQCTSKRLRRNRSPSPRPGRCDNCGGRSLEIPKIKESQSTPYEDDLSQPWTEMKKLLSLTSYTDI
ncbi:hypothetical protein Tco_0744573 [Tanacetum coccineum]